MSAEDDAPTLPERPFEISLRAVAAGLTVFEHLRLEREIGRGGMGVVWLAHDERIDLPVAVKFLPDVVAKDPEATADLKRELRRGLTLTHPGIVRVYRFEQDENGAAIVMEYVDGPTLSSQKHQQPGGCFDVDELEPLVEQLCTALEYAHHDARIVHRDLKPRNLMLTSKGRLKIADFGVAASLADTVSRSGIGKSSGTPPYMSPQQALGADASVLDDIYSLGATLYELLTGRPPFYQGNILAQVQQRVPPSIAERREILKVKDRGAVPERWEATVAACLAKDPEDRPQSAREVLECLRGLRKPPRPDPQLAPIEPLKVAAPGPARTLRRSADRDAAADEEATIRASGERPQPRRKGTAGLVLLILLVIGGAAIWWTQQEPISRAGGSGWGATGSSEKPATSASEVTTSDAVNSPDAAGEMRDEAALAAAGQLPRSGHAWENSLQMRFVPVSGTSVLFSTYETRIQDYRIFIEATQHPWLPAEFDQDDAHPVVNVSYTDAQAFCRWLTDRERTDGRLTKGQRYRLPTDEEWSRAVGLPAEQGGTPDERHQKIANVYPWGTEWPPSEGAGNYMSEGDGDESDPQMRPIEGYKDGYSHTAPVGEFKPNAIGCHDLGGNAWEWVGDWFDHRKTQRTLRGASWRHAFENETLSSSRLSAPPETADESFGFRVVLDVGS